jgi:hypothetical protein
MATPRTTPAPAGYGEIEKALHLLDMGESARWVAARLRGVANPAALEAEALLRAKERSAARAVLEAELLRLAGPEDARDLGWFSPAAPEAPRPAPLAWLRPRTDPSGRA